MAIIYTYPLAVPASGDLLIFSDVSTVDPPNATRSCTVGDLVTLVGSLIPGPGGGTVSSVKLDLAPGATGDTGLRLAAGASDQTINTSGSFDVGGTLFATHGGTGQSSYSAGEILYAPLAVSQTLSKLSIGAPGEVLTVSAANIPSWVAPSVAPVTSVTGIAPIPQPLGGTNPISVTPTTGAVTIQSLAYSGDTRAGHVPGTSGGNVAKYLNGGGVFTVPPDTDTTYSMMTDAVFGVAKLEDNTPQTTAAQTVTSTANRTYGVQQYGATGQLVVNVPWTGIFSGNGSLSGDTTISVGSDDLNFVATTGDMVFKNDGYPNPAIKIAGATNNVTIGEYDAAATTQQLIVKNPSGSNLICLQLDSSNTTGNQKGANIELSGASTINTGISIASSGATRNFALTTTLGNSGFGTATPDDSAMIEMSSTTQGFLPPRMTTVEMNAIASPAKGLMIYDTTTDEWKGNNGTPGAPTWVVIG